MKHLTASIVVSLLFVLVFIILFASILPLLSEQLANLTRQFPAMFGKLNSLLNSLAVKYDFIPADPLNYVIQQLQLGIMDSSQQTNAIGTNNIRWHAFY